jgi:hypothetical protein
MPTPASATLFNRRDLVGHRGHGVKLAFYGVKAHGQVRPPLTLWHLVQFLG